MRFLRYVPDFHTKPLASHKPFPVENSIYHDNMKDSLLQYLTLRRLGIPEIHHLVQKLVDDDEVVAYALLLQLLEVLGEDLDDLVQEEEDLGGVGVALREGEEVEVVVPDVEVL